MSTVRALTLLGSLLSVLACENKEPALVGQAPPPPATVSSNVCTSAAVPSEDPELQGMRLGRIGDYCEDPHGQFRAYGEGASSPLDDVCLQLFNGECETYKDYGLVRVNTGRFVRYDGSPAAVNVYVSRFSSQAGAYGFYTKRVVAGSDPAALRLRSMAAGVAGALGSGIAYTFSGHTVAEFNYSNELETPDQMRATADKVLPALAQVLGEKLKGKGKTPMSVQLLPQEHRLDFGIQLDYRDVLGVRGAGTGAVGFYRNGPRRYRVMVSHQNDEDSAKDTYGSLFRSPGRRSLKDMPYAAFELSIPTAPGAPAALWLVAHHNNLVVAVGDEAFALPANLTDAQRAKVSLGRGAKLSLIREVLADARKARSD